ncbi:MAG: HAMP domain-containing histidine kinase [Nitrospirae bacterium]|nr:HAMP domain-containing histidine kinase [Nitrospirota bacterium]
MYRQLWFRVFLILISVSAIALSSALVLRELMVRDFRGYLEGEVEDRASWITTSLESTFEKYSVWPNPEIVENTVWALMLGFEMKLYDADGSFVIDTDSAVNILSPYVKKRIVAISSLRYKDEAGRFQPYALFLSGREIGRVELRFLRSQKELFFVKRSNRLLIFSLLGMGGTAVFLSVIFSKRLTTPVEQLTRAVADVAEGNLASRVAASGIDEINRLSEAFNKMAHALEVQESLRKKMTSNIAHELRTPVSAIRGELEGMMDGLIPLDQEHIQSLHAEIGRFKAIIEGLEELSSAEASSLSLEKQAVSLDTFLRNIIERYRKMFSDQGVGLALDCRQAITLQADPDRLSQVVINLLSNALKATAGGGKVEVKAMGEGKAVIIEVSDTGEGIRKEDLPFIFERFYKASRGGLGLGLAIAKELVLAHEGTIAAASEYGKGTTFTISLPNRPA